MRRRRDEAGYALALACALWTLGAAGAPESGNLPACAAPSEREARGGHTLRVDCAGRGGPLRGPASVLFGGGLDPNRDDARALEAVPGIGPARAAAIVAGRGEGPYRELADLGRVHGIGPVTLRRSAPWWRFDAGEATRAGSR